MQEYKTMMVVKSVETAEDGKPVGETFRLIPISEKCPFNIAQFNKSTGSLVIIGKEVLNELRAVPKIDPNGNMVKSKAGHPEIERRMLQEYFEFSITDSDSIKEFIETVCINAKEKTMLYMPYLAKIEVKSGMESPSLILQ